MHRKKLILHKNSSRVLFYIAFYIKLKLLDNMTNFYSRIILLVDCFETNNVGFEKIS